MPAKTKTKKKLDQHKLISLYMDYVLTHEKYPKSVYKFAKDHDFEENDFYQLIDTFQFIDN